MISDFHDRNSAGTACVSALELKPEDFHDFAVALEETILQTETSDDCNLEEKYRAFFETYILAEDSQRETFDKFLYILTGNKNFITLLKMAQERIEEAA